MLHNIILGDMENIFNRNISWEVLNNKTIMITGAYGMLASYIVFFLMYLNEIKHYKIDIIAQGRDVNNAKKKFNSYWHNERFHFIDNTLTESFSSISHVDYIIHTAGVSNPCFYSTNPVEVFEPNVIGTYNLLQYAKDCKAKGFLFFSSGDVYGKLCNNQNITEDCMGTIDPLDAHSCYGESKRAGETLCSAFCREYGVRTLIARIAHTYGPTMNPYTDQRVFASFMKCILENRNIEILSDGMAKRPFCYIADATAAFFLLLLKGNSGEAYNVCNSQEFYSIKELADIMITLDKRKNLSVVYKKRQENDHYLEAKMNKDNRTVEDKLKGLGWKCEYTARVGFQRVYDYFNHEQYRHDE